MCGGIHTPRAVLQDGVCHEESVLPNIGEEVKDRIMYCGVCVVNPVRCYMLLHHGDVGSTATCLQPPPRLFASSNARDWISVIDSQLANKN